ncbi:non-homologous end-joining DNA ligase [Actinophytocola oryzae]|uniref:DNA ligase (ATP) n=1 Tax=Actinophytocola oryzae TaxID=502181 RepID=A0A4R7UXV1_9PSEU|nr:non-homologous end-joining DNA ligase [Actinophytocola oryzae]TDV40937.1 bifunctional non-homologous end joining protein LigD [Actinophytocola oryzae]
MDGVPAPVTPMLAVEGPLPVGAGWAYETKWDGFRCCVRVGPDGTTKLTSRLGNEITALYPDMLGTFGDALSGRSAVLDGELVVLGPSGRPDFHLMQYRHQRGPTAELLRTAPVTFIAFDLLALGERTLVAEPYTRRRDLLAALPVTSPHVAVPRHFTAADIDPDELLGIVAEQELEGLVAKRLESQYRPGQRSRDWIKRPLIKTQDVLVGGWRPGKRGRAGRIGGLLLGAHDALGRLRYIGDVGTGFTERVLTHLMELLTPLERRDSPFDDEVPTDRRRDVHWVEPRLVGQVVYRQFTSDHRLRHTAWRGLRDDVPTAEVRMPTSRSKEP